MQVRLFCYAIHTSLLVGAVLAPSVLGSCGNSDGGEESGGTGWEQALGEFAEGEAVFSFAFVAAPPEGSRLKVSVHTGSAEEACGLYQADENLNGGSFWYLGIETSTTDAGEYAVVHELEDGTTEERYARVQLVEVNDWSKASARVASEGRVTITSAPTNASEWGDGKLANIRIEAAFPASFAKALRCDDAVTAEDVSTATCQSEGDDGRQFECEGANGEDCCYQFSEGGEQVRFELDVLAQQCAPMCLATSPELSEYCAELG